MEKIFYNGCSYNVLFMSNILIKLLKIKNDMIFRAKINVTLMSNNSRELLGLRQQSGVLTLVKNKYTKYIMRIGADSTGLDR